MECREALERLSPDVDGELPEAEATALRQHLRTCQACSKRRALLEDTRRAFRLAAATPAPTRHWNPRLAIRWWLLGGASAAAVLALALLGGPKAPEQPVATVATMAGQPGWSEGRWDTALDCGRPGATECVLEAPCKDGDCSLLITPVDFAGRAALR